MSFRRLSAWSGVAFVVLILASSFIAGESSPTVTDSPEEVTSYLVDNNDALLVGNFLSSLAGVAFVVFLAGLYQRLRETDRQTGEPWAFIGLIGAILLGVAATIAQAAASVAILRAEEGTGVAAAFFDLSLMGYALTGVMITIMLIGFSMAMARARLMPMWVTWLGYVGALVGLVGSASAGSRSDTLGFIGFLAFLVFTLWVLSVSVLLMRSESAPVTASPA
ncbi:MAG: DUF4386 family protein [Actinomycetota bacterium]